MDREGTLTIKDCFDHRQMVLEWKGNVYPTIMTHLVEYFEKENPEVVVPAFLCPDFFRTGKCIYWENCKKVHVRPEYILNLGRHYMCGQWKTCTRDKCPYAHSIEQMRSLPKVSSSKSADVQVFYKTSSGEDVARKIPEKYLIANYGFLRGASSHYVLCFDENCGDYMKCKFVHLSPSYWLEEDVQRNVPPPAFYLGWLNKQKAKFSQQQQQATTATAVTSAPSSSSSAGESSPSVVPVSLPGSTVPVSPSTTASSPATGSFSSVVQASTSSSTSVASTAPPPSTASDVASSSPIVVPAVSTTPQQAQQVPPSSSSSSLPATTTTTTSKKKKKKNAAAAAASAPPPPSPTSSSDTASTTATTRVIHTKNPSFIPSPSPSSTMTMTHSPSTSTTTPTFDYMPPMTIPGPQATSPASIVESSLLLIDHHHHTHHPPTSISNKLSIVTLDDEISYQTALLSLLTLGPRAPILLGSGAELAGLPVCSLNAFEKSLFVSSHYRFEGVMAAICGGGGGGGGGGDGSSDSIPISVVGNYVIVPSMIISSSSPSRVVYGWRIDDGIEVALKTYSLPANSENFRNDLKQVQKFSSGVDGFARYLGVTLTDSSAFLISELMECSILEIVRDLWNVNALIGSGMHFLAVEYLIGSVLIILSKFASVRDATSARNLMWESSFINPVNICLDRFKNVKLSKLNGAGDDDFPNRCYSPLETEAGGSGRHFTSEIYSLGQVFRFLITGVHPHISKHPTYMELFEETPMSWPPYKRESACHLLANMTLVDASRRGFYGINGDECLSALLCHPFFWDDWKATNFLIALGGLVDSYNLSASMKEFESLRVCLTREYEDWLHLIDSRIRERFELSFPPSHGGRSCLDLFKLIRIAYLASLNALSSSLEDTVTQLVLDGPYFLHVFPRLVVLSWAICLDEPFLRNHFILRPFMLKSPYLPSLDLSKDKHWL